MLSWTGSTHDTPATMTTVRRRLMVIGAYVLAGAVSLASAAGLAVPRSSLAAVATAIALAYTVTAARLETVRAVAGYVVAASAAALIPLTTLSLRQAPLVLITVGLALALSMVRAFPYHLHAAVAVMFGTIHVTSRGTGLLLAAIAFFGGLALAAALNGRRTGQVALLTPAELFGSLTLVVGLAVGEIARRSTLSGIQLPGARWALFALVVAAAGVIAANRSVSVVLGRKALPVLGTLLVFATLLVPARGAAEDLRTDSSLQSTLAALGSSGDSTAMIGEEGAGPRPQFRGIGFDNCDVNSIRDCLITYFDDIATNKGMQASIDEIVDRVQNNVGRSFPTHCHQVVHNLGQMAYELADGDFALVSSYDPQVCGTGFIHGLYERYFDRYGKLLFTETGDICRKMNLVQPWYAWTCNHILGHTLMAKMMQNPSSASEFCLQMLDNEYFGDCVSGAWMNFFSDDAVLSWFRANAMGEPEKAFSICYGAETYTKFYCYQELFPVLTTISGDNLPMMARWCREYSEPARGSDVIYSQAALYYAEICMQGVARVVAVANGYDYRISMLRCVELTIPEQADTCLAAAGAAIVLNTGSVTAGIEMCERVKNIGYREYCFIWVKQVSQTLRSGPNSNNMPQFGEIRIPDLDLDVTLPAKETDKDPASRR
jgi:hypothetical protein